MTELMTNIDNFWLNLDDPTNLMVITALFEFNQPLDIQNLYKTIDSKWLSYDRFKMRIVKSAFGQTRWEDDPTFDLRSHIHRVALPKPGGKKELQEMIGDLASKPLDPNKPLWQIHLIENYGGGCVVFWQIHHCVADGMSLSHAMLSLGDKVQSGSNLKIPSINKEYQKKTTNQRSMVGKLRDIPGQLKKRMKRQEKSLSKIINFSSSLTEVLHKQAVMDDDPQTVFKGQLGVRKSFSWSHPLPLKQVKEAGKRLDGTINDVLVAGVTGALRRYLQDNNTPIKDLNLKVSMPVNVRDKGIVPKPGNEFGVVSLSLPIHIEDPILRIKEVKRRNDKIKASCEASMSYQLLKSMGALPSDIGKKTINYFANKGTAVFSNVPGPQKSMSFAGQEISNMMFWVPRSGNTGMGISILSYAGKVILGLVTDEGLVADPQLIANYFNDEMQQLFHLVQPEQKYDSLNDFFSINQDIPVNKMTHDVKKSKPISGNMFSNFRKNISTLGLKSIPSEMLKEKYACENSKFVDINGTKVHYCEQGEGPALLLLHGMLASLHTWNDWEKILSNNHRIIRLDIPGFGLTTPLETKPYCKNMYIDFLNTFIEVIGLDKFDIAGNSIGGYIAWNYALNYPEKINKLILIDAVGYPQNLPGIVNFVNTPVLSSIAGKITPRIFIDRNIREIYGDKTKVTEALIDQYFDMVMNSDNRGVFIDIFRLLKTECASDELCSGIKNIQSPTLLMWGKDDPWVPVDVVKRWEQDLVNVQTVLYDGVGHLPMEEIPQQSAYDAHSFLVS